MRELLPYIPILPKPYLVIIDGAHLVATFFHEYDIIESDAVSLRINMKLSHRICLITLLSKSFSKSFRFRHLHVVGINPVTMRRRESSCHQAPACRNAHRT